MVTLVCPTRDTAHGLPPEVPTFLDGNIIGKHDFSRGQIAIMKHKVC